MCAATALLCAHAKQLMAACMASPYRAACLRCCRRRFLPPGQRVDVWVELQLPPSSANCHGGMAQVVAELASLDGKTAARTSRPLLLRRGSGWDAW